MDCNEIQEKVALLLDGELPEGEKKELIKQIRECKEYEDIYESEKCFKEYLQNSLVKKQLSPSVIQNIKAYVTDNRI